MSWYERDLHYAMSGAVLEREGCPLYVDSHPTLGVQQKILRSFWASNLRSSISHPKHDFEDVRSRNPTNTSMRWP